MNFFEQKSNRFNVDGPVGKLEALLDGCPANIRGIAIVCHPHPLYDGTMHNKVAHTLARAYRDTGIAAIRFNFRGVGASEGAYGDGVGEVEDLRAMYRFVRAHSGALPIYLAGFSFGSMVAAKGAEFIKPKHLTIVAPPAEKYSYPIRFDCPVLLMQGTADEVCSFEAALAWGQNLHPEAVLEVFEGGSHFFHGALVDLKKRLVAHLTREIEST